MDSQMADFGTIRQCMDIFCKYKLFFLHFDWLPTLLIS